MLTRRKIISSVALGLALTMLMTISASAQQAQPDPLDGSAYFRDANAVSDQLVVDLTGAKAFEPGAPGWYEGWLVAGYGTEDSDWVNVGRIGRPFVDGKYGGGDIQGSYVDPDGTNLLERYDTFIITIETNDVPDRNPDDRGVDAYGARVPGPVLSRISALIGKGSGPAAMVRDQAASILADARAASNADDLDERKTRAQSVIDALDGLVTQAQAASAQADDIVLSGAAGDDQSIKDTANGIIQAANCVTRLAENTRAAAMRVVDAPAVDIAVKVQTQNLLLDADRMYNGTGLIAGGGCAGGGALAVYEKTQDLGAFRPRQGALPATGDALVSTVALAALLAGLALAIGGGMLVLRGRRMTVAAA